MRKSVSARYSHGPLVFIIVPLLLFVFLKKWGIIVFFGFLTPIFKYFGKVFTRYTLKDETLIIHTLFKKEKIAWQDIQSIRTIRATWMQQFMWALPLEYQVILDKFGNEFIITPLFPLIHDSLNGIYYFKN